MGKIVQIIDSLHNERLLFRICKVVGTYNNPFAPSSELLLKRSCFLVEPSKTATFSDLVKVVGKRIKNEKHKFGVLYENGKLENHWLTNEEVNNKTR